MAASAHSGLLVPAVGKKRIVLFYPRVAAPEYHRLPWATLALAGNLPSDRYEVRLVDGGKEPDPIRAVIDAAQGAEMVGISCFTGNQTVNALKAARALRRAYPMVPLVWGGAHPSMYLEQTLADPNVDVVIKGQGEWAIAQVADALTSGAEPAGIPGVSYKTRRGQPVYGAKAKMRDQNQFGRPPFEQLDPNRYLVHILIGARALTYHSSTGCPFACQFCTVNFEFEFGWTAYSAERTVDELDYLLKRAPAADAIEFADSNLIVNPKRIVELCERMLQKGVARPWNAFGRPDQLAKLPREVWKLMAESGCKRFFVGLESGDPHILEKIQKEHTNEQVYLMAERMAEYGIAPDLSFTLGYPDDPERDVRMSLELCRDLKRIVPASVFVLNTYTPYESTPLYQEAVQHGLRTTSSLSDWERNEWKNFGFRKTITPWMTDDIDRMIRDFETLAAATFFLEEDLFQFKGVKQRGRPLRDAMIRLARRQWAKGELSHPTAVKALRRLYFAINPALNYTTASLVDGHQAGVRPE